MVLVTAPPVMPATLADKVTPSLARAALRIARTPGVMQIHDHRSVCSPVFVARRSGRD